MHTYMYVCRCVSMYITCGGRHSARTGLPLGDCSTSYIYYIYIYLNLYLNISIYMHIYIYTYIHT